MPDDRMLLLEGVHNFRDYGNYPVVGGGRVRSGLLWRSGQHHDATDADLTRIGALGLVQVFDLRSDRERKAHPCRRPDGFTGEVDFESYGADGPGLHQAPHVEALERPVRTAQSTHEAMRQSYATIAYRPQLVGLLRRMLARLADGEGPSLVNCMAGKDRTGIACMAVQHALGVHRDDILADYLLTNTAGDVEARIEAGYRTVRSLTGDLDEAAKRAIMGVDAEYLEIALEAIRERSGSLDKWLEHELGVDAVRRDRLRACLIE